MPAMFVTKNLAELCALLIDEFCGELPSRIFATLLTRGRSSLPELVQQTSLSPRQLRTGLAVLLQRNCLYYNANSRDTTTLYEANPAAAYNLIRTGKLLQMVGSEYGVEERDVIQSLLNLGHASIGDLKDAYDARIQLKLNGSAQINGGKNGVPASTQEDAHVNGGADGDQEALAGKTVGPIQSTSHLNSILCRLVEAEIVEVVNPRTFQSPDTILKDVEQEILAKDFPDGIKGTKAKEDYQDKFARRLQEIHDEGKTLKRKLRLNGGGGGLKKRRLNGGFTSTNHGPETGPMLDPKTVIRVNHDKCLVELRNRRLAKFASDLVGETTGQIYAALLQILTRDVSRCQRHKKTESASSGEQLGGEDLQPRVTTMEILDSLDGSIDVARGIGKAPASQVNTNAAEKIEEHPPMRKIAVLEAEDGEELIESSDEDESEDDEDGADEDLAQGSEDEKPLPKAEKRALNGKVKFDDDDGSRKDSRFTQMRRHLLLLVESKQKFVRHCGREQWTVDFEPLVQSLQESELDTYIESYVGRQGLRLARILRDKGRLDEKTLPAMALMKKSDVQEKMLAMQMAGFVDIQEVPKDQTRAANRTIFLWFTDTNQSLTHVLDKTYKTMVRVFQVLEKIRYDNREVLSIAERVDVKGQEKEKLEEKYFADFNRYCSDRSKLLGLEMRLDSLVAALRDY